MVCHQGVMEWEESGGLGSRSGLLISWGRYELSEFFAAGGAVAVGRGP